MKRKKRTHLNFILPPHKKFRTIGIFTNYVENRLRKQEREGKLTPTDSYFVLFHETPFGNKYFPRRSDVKNAIKKLGKLLQTEFPNVRVGFSINEQVPRGKRNEKPTFSNTGYLVGEGTLGYKTYPKLALTQFDDKTIKHAVGNKRADEVEEHWNMRSDRLSDAKNPFPRVKFKTGHTVEYRICADAGLEKTKEKIITAISAEGISRDYLNYLIRTRKLVVLNDSIQGAHFHSPVIQTPVPVDAKILNPDSFNRTLSNRRIRFHRWK